MKKVKTLKELFSFPGFIAQSSLEGVFGDHKARIITLKRQKKRLNVQVAESGTEVIMTTKKNRREILMQEAIEYTCDLNNGEWIADIVWASE